MLKAFAVEYHSHNNNSLLLVRFSATGTGSGFAEQGSPRRSDEREAPETGRADCEGELTNTWQHGGQNEREQDGEGQVVVKVGPVTELPP